MLKNSNFNLKRSMDWKKSLLSMDISESTSLKQNLSMSDPNNPHLLLTILEKKALNNLLKF